MYLTCAAIWGLNAAVGSIVTTIYYLFTCSITYYGGFISLLGDYIGEVVITMICVLFSVAMRFTERFCRKFLRGGGE